MGKKDFCCAEGCGHQRDRGATCSFYSIPSDSKLKSAWLSKISRVTKVIRSGKKITLPWKPSPATKLCGCHFETPPPAKPGKRKHPVIPTIFSHRPPSEKKRRVRKERQPMAPCTVGSKDIKTQDVSRSKCHLKKTNISFTVQVKLR